MQVSMALSGAKIGVQLKALERGIDRIAAHHVLAILYGLMAYATAHPGAESLMRWIERVSGLEVSGVFTLWFSASGFLMARKPRRHWLFGLALLPWVAYLTAMVVYVPNVGLYPLSGIVYYLCILTLLVVIAYGRIGSANVRDALGFMMTLFGATVLIAPERGAAGYFVRETAEIGIRLSPEILPVLLFVGALSMAFTDTRAGFLAGIALFLVYVVSTLFYNLATNPSAETIIPPLILIGLVSYIGLNLVDYLRGEK